jgi:hypothetical protein
MATDIKESTVNPHRTSQQQAIGEADDRRRAALEHRILRVVSAAVGGWRFCTAPGCRRRHRCSDPSLVCLAIWRRSRPVVQMTPQEHALWASNFKKEIEAEQARRAEQNMAVARRDAAKQRGESVPRKRRKR